MYKTNKYNGKKYKKKHIYSSIKSPYIVSDRLLEKKDYTGIDIFMEAFDLNDCAWMIFFRDILKGKKHSPFEPENRLENIMYLINDDRLQKKIYTQLMDIDNYNPLENEMPIEKLSPDIQSYIKQIQDLIIKNKESLEQSTFYITHDNIEIKSAIALNTKLKKVFFKSNYGIIFTFEENHLIISPNYNYQTNNQIIKIDFNDFYNTVKQMYPETKFISKSSVDIPLKNNEVQSDIVKGLIPILQSNMKLISK